MYYQEFDMAKMQSKSQYNEDTPQTSNTSNKPIPESRASSRTKYRIHENTWLHHHMHQYLHNHSVSTPVYYYSNRKKSTMEDISIHGSNTPNQENKNAANNNAYFKIFGNTEKEKMFIFTGTVERIIRWNKIFQDHFCYYEVIASVISIQEGSTSTQKIMLLRDKKGPILQVIYYTDTHIDIEDFHVEQVLRCLGRMSVPNIFNAVSIRAATQQEIENLQRFSLVCDHAISHFIGI